MLKFLTSRAGAYVVLAVIAVLAIWYFTGRIKKSVEDATTVSAIVDALPVVSAMNRAGGVVSGNKEFSLGNWLENLWGGKE